MDFSTQLKIEIIFQYILLLFFLGLFIHLIQSFLFVILFAIAIVISTYSIYESIQKIVKKSVLASGIMLVLISVIMLLPTYLISVKLYQDSLTLYDNRNEIYNFEISNCESQTCDQLESNLKLFFSSTLSTVQSFGESLGRYIYSFLTSLSNFIIQIFIFYVCLFYFYLDKERFLTTFKRLLPLKTQYKEALIIKFKKVCTAVFLDTLLIAIMQGTLVGIGFYLFGLEGGIIWGIIASFLALLPFLGSGFIWIPASLYLLLIGDYAQGIGFFLYGAIVVSLSDNLVRPYLLEKSIHVHPFLILLSIMGGIKIWGFLGIFYGPIIVSMLVSLIELYDIEFK